MNLIKSLDMRNTFDEIHYLMAKKAEQDNPSQALEPCNKCHTLLNPNKLSSGLCFFCSTVEEESECITEKTHFQCCDCEDWFLKQDIRDLSDGYFCFECRPFDDLDQADEDYDIARDFEDSREDLIF